MDNLTTRRSYNKLVNQLSDTYRHYLTPPDRKKLSKWATENIFIGGGVGPEVGPYRWERAPYQKDILDECGDPHVRRVVLMMAAQTGKTILQGCVASYYMAGDPCPILAVLPSNSAAKKWNFSKLAPTIQATPILNNLLTEDSILKKIYPGGYFVLVGARSTDAFRMLSVRVLLLDEVDAWPPAIADEGSPLSLARGRTTAWWNSKEILVSTPTTKDSSLIHPEYLESSQNHFYVPCSHCGQYQVLYWRTIGYDNDDPQTAHFKCQFNEETIADEEWVAENRYYPEGTEFQICGKKSTESKKMDMLRKGKWVSHNPSSRTPGFWLPSTYSPWFSWEQLVYEWVGIKTIDQRKSFIQTRLAEPWEERTDKVESHELVARLETYPSQCPKGVGFIIGSCDVQQERIECTIWGYGKDEEVWVLDHQIFYGPVFQDSVWNQLKKFMEDAAYANEHGAKAKVSAWAIDTGFFTQYVYPFIKHMTLTGFAIYGVKGSSTIKASPTPDRPTFNKQFKIYIWETGVNEIKNILVPRLLTDPPGPGTLHLPISVDGEFLNQLTSEQRVRETNRKTGELKMYWKKVGPRNEILDTYVYSYFVYLIHFKDKNANIDAAIETLSSTVIPEQPIEEKKEETTQQLKLAPFTPERKRTLPGAGSWYEGWR